MKTEAPDTESFAAVAWRAGRLRLLDQRRLPGEIVYLDYDSAQAVAGAITAMVTRGAPAIGIAAAYAVALAGRAAWQMAGGAWRQAIEADLDTLAAARPTAVNLRWAIAKMRRAFPAITGDPEAALLARVYVSETRPALQGARLTCWELQRARIPCTLLVDGAIAGLMRDSRIHWLIVGADRIAANGDVANKTGTYAHALAAKYHGVKVMVVAPAATVDLALCSGAAIPIEQRPPHEVTAIHGGPLAPAGVTAENPAFDITPRALVDALVSERGVVARPDSEKMRAVFGAETPPG